MVLPSAHTIPTVDRLDILDLYARQSHAIDGGNAAGWADTFTTDGVFISPTYRLTATGHSELESFARTSNDGALARGDQLRHWLDAVVMTRVSEDAVHVEAYLMILATSAAGSRVDRSLRVIDELVRVAGAWLLAERTVLRDAPAP